MKLPLKKMLLWVLPLIIIISVQPLKAQETAILSIQTTDTIDVCGNDKRVIVTVSLGNVLKSDSLLYFDIELKYDPTKVQFNQILTSGTLSEQFAGEIPATGEFSGVGYARAYAGSFKDIPVSGNKPLIGFLGTAKSTCPDTTEVILSSLDLEFKRTIIDTQKAVIIAREGKSANRFVSLASTVDSINLNDTVNSQTVNFKISGSQGTRLKEGILKVDYNHSSFKVSQIIPATSNIEIVKVDSNSTGLEISFKALDTNSLALREIQTVFERIKDTTETSIATAFIKDINQCSCISLLKDTVNIKVNNIKKIVNSIQTGKEPQQEVKFSEKN